MSTYKGNEGIGWTHILGPGTGATWNPIRARGDMDHPLGWFCIKISEGCKNCYAETLNVGRFGNGLEYKVTNLEKVKLVMPGFTYEDHGQTAIDWPLRVKKSHGIFPVDMSDWCGEFVPPIWANYILGVMALSQHHVFLPLTKRYRNLYGLLKYWSDANGRMAISVPETKEFNLALLKAHGNKHRWTGGSKFLAVRNDKYTVELPFPTPNILFGVSICNQAEADRILPVLKDIKELDPGFRLYVSYEPALEPIDWLEFKGLIDWLIVGGESGKNARRMDIDCIASTIGAGKELNIPIYVKQMGTILANEMGLKDDKGTDLPEEYAIHQFPNVEGSYIPWATK